MNLTISSGIFSQLSLLLRIIFNQYFKGDRCSLQFSDDFFVHIPNSAVFLYNTRYDNPTYVDAERCHDFIIIAHNFTQIFDKFEAFIRKENSTTRYNSRRYVFVSFNDGYKKLMQSVNLEFVTEVLIVNAKMGIVELLTHAYVGRNDHNSTIFLDFWYHHNESFLYGNNLFPNKLKNQMGRVLKVASSSYLPYSDMENMCGFELMFITEYCKQRNITMELIRDEWGSIETNTGILGGVIADKYDIGLSALFMLPERLEHSDFSIPTAHSRVTCLVPIIKEGEGLLKFVTVLSYRVWMLTFVCYASAGIFMHVYTLLRVPNIKTQRFKGFFLIYTIFIVQALPKSRTPKQNLLQFTYIVLLVLTLLYFTIYSSRLSAILTIPNYKEIETVPKLADSELDWGELYIDWALPLEDDQREKYQVIYKKFHIKTETELRELSLKHGFAFGIERLLSGYYAVGSYIKEDVIDGYGVMKEDLYRQYTNLQLRKNSVLLNSVNDALGIVTQAGLLFYWESNAISNTNLNVQTSLRSTVTESQVSGLTWTLLRSVFLYWFIGICISAIVFSWELLSENTKRKKLMQMPRRNYLN